MNKIELTGLRGDLPISAMAAFGVLRICSRASEIEGPKLCWIGEGGDYRAALVMRNGMSADALVDTLIADVRERRSKLPEWDQVKTRTKNEFRSAACAAAEASSPKDREAADWLSALSNELAVGDDGKMESTPFDMSVARQKFIADAGRLASWFAERPATDDYKEALFGPWEYHDDQHSLGWDPTTIKLGAFTYKAPTGMANSGVRAAVWLAFESLPLFPCFYRGRLRTRGFVQRDRKAVLSWPIWRPSISVEELGALLGWTPLGEDEPDRAEMQGRGIMAVYRSERFKPNQYLATFRPPEMAYLEG